MHAVPRLLFSGILIHVSLVAAAADPVIAELVVEASSEAVWDAYTRHEDIEAWMVPSSSELKLGIGALWLTSYEQDSSLDNDTVITSEILAFDPGRMLAVRTIRPPADFPFPNAIVNTWSVLYIEPVDLEHTRVTVRMFGFGDDPESQEMRNFFEWGNAYELDKLAEYLQLKQDE